MDRVSATFYQQERATLKQGEAPMNVTVNVDCTPEEARRFIGLPDLSSVHEVYLQKIRTMIDQGVTPDTVESMLRNWGPMGEASMAFWRQMFDQLGGPK